MDNRDNKYFDLDSLAKEDSDKGRDVPKDTAGKSRFGAGLAVGVLSMLMLIGIVYVGISVQRYLELKNDPMKALAKQLEYSKESAITPITVGKLQTIEEVIGEYFSLGEVDDSALADGIYKGMLEALDDPYSEYYTAEELESLMEHSEGVYYGIGAYISLDSATSLPKISGVIEGTPAEAAKLRDNDIVYEVDGETTYGLTLEETVALIKGEEGTEVVLTIYREGEPDYLDIPVTRAMVVSPAVTFEMIDDTTAYIELIEFSDVAVDQFAEALAMAKGYGMTGLILDLRANPGGNLGTVVEIARMMLPEGLIVYTEDKNGERLEYTCDGEHRLDVPLVVLIDMNSASASEILAGAVQDYGIGTLVGTTTYGKGIVQQIFPFSDGSAVKLTISSYFTPKGRNIHEVGIEPDVFCEFDGEAYYDEENPVDTQLEKAKEVLESLR